MKEPLPGQILKSMQPVRLEAGKLSYGRYQQEEQPEALPSPKVKKPK